MVREPPIGEHAVIGDGRSAALISKDGAIDWLCWPRFDSPSLFAALLDRRTGGEWSIRPAGPAAASWRYLEETNVLETRYRTATGTALVTDFMPALSEEAKRRLLLPEHELIRRIACTGGEVEMRIAFVPRPDYARVRDAVRNGGPLGFRIERGASVVTLRSEVVLRPDAAGGVTGLARLRAGESAALSLSYAAEGPAILPPLGPLVEDTLAWSLDWWRRWAARARYSGPHRGAVVRSALALKLLSYAPSGAILAAPTTSLPERLGGDMNWDYRFCWLRDAAFTARALSGLGYREEAEAFVSWMLHATALTRPELRILYDVFGESGPREATLSHLRGYAGSRPVRIGNAAREQRQLDVYGEVIDAVTHVLPPDAPLDGETQQMLRQFGDYVCRHWDEADSGIWERRGGLRHFTHSRLLCWVALDRLLEMQRLGRMHGLPEAEMAAEREHIRAQIAARGWNPSLESYTDTLDGRTCDATGLLVAFHGFDDATSPRMSRTFRRIRERLGAGPGLLYRSEQSPEDGEGAFAMCSFWIADFLARGGGTLEEARGAFERTASYASDLGLFAEEIDPRTGAALGNFPQAFTHVGLINAALSLEQREARERGDGR